MAENTQSSQSGNIIEFDCREGRTTMGEKTAKFGCPVCYHHGKWLTNNACIYWPEASNYSLRNHSQWILYANWAMKSFSTILDIMGKSPLISSFDMVASIPIDYMHAVLEGVVKRLLVLWFNYNNHCQPYYLGCHVCKIDTQLLQQYPTSEFNQLPSQLSITYTIGKCLSCVAGFCSILCHFLIFCPLSTGTTIHSWCVPCIFSYRKN